MTCGLRNTALNSSHTAAVFLHHRGGGQEVEWHLERNLQDLSSQKVKQDLQAIKSTSVQHVNSLLKATVCLGNESFHL